MKGRNVTYDFLRVLACVMIVAMHSPLPSEHANGALVSTLSYLTAPGIGLFFMISGALLLPMKVGTKTFLKKRFTKILFPTIFWSLFYLCMNMWLKGKTIDWVYVLPSLPFSAQGSSILWFMYTLMGLYLITPILSRWLKVASEREQTFYLCLWVVSLCYPIIRYVAKVNESNTGILYYFSGYVGYFFLGCYLKQYPNKFSMKWSIFAFGIALGAAMICWLKKVEVDFYDLFWYLSIFVAIQCVFWWKVIHTLEIRGKMAALLATLSNLSFGIYLSHIIIMRYLLWEWPLIKNIANHPFQTFVVAILTLLLSAFVSYVISFLPGAQYIIGYKRKS